MDFSEAALLLAAHGSDFDRDASSSTLVLAGQLRRLGVFAEVHAAFWRETPRWREALSAVRARRIFVVPHFVSRGYFTETVLRRELMVSGGERVIFCGPVGMHPLAAEALLHAAREAVSASAPPARETCLLIVGHGTLRNKNSAAVAREHAERIARGGHYGECRAVFMEEPPLAKDWTALTVKPNVIAVPFFISTGRHYQVDLPLMMGLQPGERLVTVSGKKLWYARPVGGDARMVEIVLALAGEAAARFDADGHK
ncbi:MAG: hypothetical protein LBD30_06610 [Verrucomicrobiales bacterium]|jgi:sirohydrochlorin cobaltochelatase|nr:hypothetical protein [Verrucomicrobiales bacterium]